MSNGDSLRKAQKTKEDEFYTQASDIENELKHYREHFRGQIVFCNCDDPTSSEFWKYFHLNFNLFGLKKLISTHYDAHEPTYKIEYTGGDDNDWTVGTKTRLRQNGDFRSEECIDLLIESTITVTNPPFSLFREYVDVLEKYDKKFIIIGSQNNVTYKEIFPLLKGNKVWLGYNYGDMAFKVPSYYEPRKTRYWQDETGQKWRSMGNICWYTNLDIRKRHEKLILWKHYTPEEFPNYDGYDAIEVGKVQDIPVDYSGVMGVPITFLTKYSPEQFEIVGIDRYTVPKDVLVGGRLAVNGKSKYARILIRRKDLV